MQAIEMADGTRIHVRVDGPEDGRTVLFLNSLGTDLRVWDRLLAALPADVRAVRMDKRGHGLSEVTPGGWGMGDLVADAAAVLDRVVGGPADVVGLSIGGMIAQGLAAERPELVRSVVLMDTAAKIGTEAIWEERIAAVEAGGIEALETAILERWFSRRFRAEEAGELALWRAMLCRTPLRGYVTCAVAIRDTDLRESTPRLSLPALGICGDEDGSTPPDLVRETTEMIAGSRFALIRGSGHLPCVEAPAETAAEIAAFWG